MPSTRGLRSPMGRSYYGGSSIDSDSLISRRARDVETVIQGTGDVGNAVERSASILLDISGRRNIQPRHYPKIPLSRFVLYEECEARKEERAARLKRMKRERARRELEEKEREEWKLLSPHLSPEKPSFEPFSEAEMREELTARDEERSEWLFSRRSALPAPVPSCERSKTVPTAEMARNKHQLDPQRYTDLSLHWGPTRDATGTLMHSESLARWQQHVQTFPNTNGASAAGIKDREPLPRKYLWSKEDGLAGRVASWDADEGRKFWRGWSAHSEMAHEGVSKAGKRDALERAKAMREKYGGLTLEKARIVVASLSKKKADAFTSEELELFERAKKYLIEVHQERASTAAAAASGSKRIPRKPWDARWIHASRSFGNEERMPQRRRCFSSFPKRPEAYLDKMLGRMTSVTEKLLTADERKLKDEFLGKVNALALKKAEREAAQANKKKK